MFTMRKRQKTKPTQGKNTTLAQEGKLLSEMFNCYYILLHVHTRTHTRMRTQTHRHTRMRTQTRAHSMHTQTRAHMYAHTNTCTHRNPCTHVCAHVCTRTQACMRVRACVHTHTRRRSASKDSCCGGGRSSLRIAYHTLALIRVRG